MLLSGKELGVLFIGAVLSPTLVGASPKADARDRDSSIISRKTNVLLSSEALRSSPTSRATATTRRGGGGGVRGATPSPPSHEHSSETSPARHSQEVGARHEVDAGEAEENWRRMRSDVATELWPPEEMPEEGESSDEAMTISVGDATIVGAKPEEVNRCSTFNLSAFDTGRECGAPLSSPCFDLSRCVNGPSIYVYDYECTLADSKDLPTSDHELDDTRHRSSHWREAAKEAGLLAETYEEACMFIHINAHAHIQPCAILSPLWNEGKNHMMMEFTDWSRDMRPVISNSYAMEGASNQHTCYYRSEFDMSVPLPPNVIFPEVAPILPLDREYFLTFKGTLYLGGHGIEQRLSLAPIHDEENGVIVALRCHDLHGQQLLPQNYKFCQKMSARNDEFDYKRLMSSTFGLIPGGRSPGTFRLGEVMSAGVIPVFVVRDWVRPFREQIDWPSFSFVFTPDEVETVMLPTLRAVAPEKLKEMQEKSLEAYWKIFGGATDYSVIARNTVDQLGERLGHH